MLKITGVLTALIMSASFGLVSMAVSAGPEVKKLRGAIVVDSHGKEIGTLVGDHHWASNVQSVIGLKIGINDYILHVRPTNLTSAGDAMADFESNDCSGQGYIRVDNFQAVSSRSMTGTVPTIASKDPVTDPPNETLWEADTSLLLVREIKSFWNTQHTSEEGQLGMPPICFMRDLGEHEVFPLVEVFDLSALFTPPYSLRLK